MPSISPAPRPPLRPWLLRARPALLTRLSPLVSPAAAPCQVNLSLVRGAVIPRGRARSDKGHGSNRTATETKLREARTTGLLIPRPQARPPQLF